MKTAFRSLRKCLLRASSSDIIAFFRDPATLDLDGEPPVLGVGDWIAPLAAACAGVKDSLCGETGALCDPLGLVCPPCRMDGCFVLGAELFEDRCPEFVDCVRLLDFFLDPDDEPEFPPAFCCAIRMSSGAMLKGIGP